MGNHQDGVAIGAIATLNSIGGATAAARNIISGNLADGVSIIGTLVGENTTGNLVWGNYIGTSFTGEQPLGNGRSGVLITSAPNNNIGLAGAGNVISGNGENGVTIMLPRATGNLVLGNLIGTDAGGTNALGNALDGVLLDTAASIVIGGTAAGARNIISGNIAAGVEIRGGGSISNLVQGNYIGTDKTGTKEMGNGVGVMIEAGARNNTLGGTVPGAPNVITHNYHDGVDVLGTDTSANQILGNYIGLIASGTVSSSPGNGGDGVLVEADSTTIQGNIISANFVNGVHLSGAGRRTTR